MGIPIKHKFCRTCNKLSYIWSRGRCKPCAMREKPQKISQVSDKRKQDNKSYTTLRKLFLDAHPECACGGVIKGCDGMATTIHHSRGRIGSLYLDVRYFKGLTLSCHAWVELHPIEAKEMGLSEDRLSAEQ